jgi:membrane protease YdiL (CAAX protease family)
MCRINSTSGFGAMIGVTMAVNTAQTGVELSSRVKSTRLVYAALLLIATSASFYFLVANYSMHLMTRSQFALARTVEEYLPPARLFFFFVQLLVILFFFRPLGMMSDFGAVRRPAWLAFGKICLGLCVGFAALLVTAPTLIGIHRTSGIVMFLADHLSTVGGVGLMLLLVLLLPFLQAVFFQGILLRQLLESISVFSALIVSTLVFMLSWPAFNMIAGAALGLAAGIVFWRTKSVFACAVANAFFTAGVIMLQLWRLP